MKVKLAAIRRKELPSRFGGTWSLVEVKLEGQGDKVYTLEGYDKKFKENLVVGNELEGYFSQKTWAGRDGQQNVNPTFNKITPEYVYNLLLKAIPDIEARANVAAEVPVAVPNAPQAPLEPSWDTGSGSTGGSNTPAPGF